jgi:hypothetical protein
MSIKFYTTREFKCLLLFLIFDFDFFSLSFSSLRFETESKDDEDKIRAAAHSRLPENKKGAQSNLSAPLAQCENLANTL